MHIAESLNIKAGNRISFANNILKDENKIEFEPKVCYSLTKYKEKVIYDILIDRSEKP